MLCCCRSRDTAPAGDAGAARSRGAEAVECELQRSASEPATLPRRPPPPRTPRADDAARPADRAPRAPLPGPDPPDGRGGEIRASLDADLAAYARIRRDVTARGASDFRSDVFRTPTKGRDDREARPRGRATI